MTRLNRQIDTRLPIEEAFAFVADFSNAEEWDPGVASAERIDEAPTGVGSRYRLDVRMGSRIAPMEYRISVFEPPSRVVLTGAGSGITAVDDIRFEATETGTRVDYIADIHLGGVLRLVEPFLGSAFAKVASGAAGGMQRTLDARADVVATPTDDLKETIR